MNYKRTKVKSRSGVTLLLTISMVVLFLLMGTAFVIVANDYFKTTVRRTRLNSYKVNSADLLDRAFRDVFRGPALTDTSSSLRGQSILEDQYGYGFKTTLQGVSNGPTSAFKTLIFSNVATPTIEPELVRVRGDGSTTFDWAGYVDGLFNGQVISIVSGSGAGYSTRIVSHLLFDDGSGNLSLRVLIPTDEQGIQWLGTNSVNSEALAGQVEVLINGRDFSGFGTAHAGLPDFDADPGVAAPALLEALALQPNRSGEALSELTNNTTGYLRDDGSTNEPYDIPDDQNMFLSGMLANAGGGTRFVPSFHRDQLYFDQFTAGDTPADIRRISFRPIFVDDFGNPAIGSTAQRAGLFGAFQPNGQLTAARNNPDALDVDSDGDGENDSVWIDIGLPIQTDNQGRQFRPLVAYLIKDMDGRLNLNAHGSYADFQLGAGTRRGAGYGVAEISLRGVAGGGYEELLNARSGSELPPRPGNPDNQLGVAQNLFGFPDVGFNTGNLFSTGVDIFGRSVVGRSTALHGNDGLPEYVSVGTVNTNATNTAYPVDLGVGGGVGDSLFQPFEMERLLRDRDVDSQIPNSRIANIGNLATNGDLITTDSAEIAMPPASVLQKLLFASGNRDDARTLILSQYLSNDILMGGRFDLNQPVGNGIDDDGDGVVDDPEELGSTLQRSDRQDGLPFDLDNAAGGVGEHLAGAIKARQLYTLALLVTGPTPAVSNSLPNYITGPATVTDVDYRRFVAQWAVNVVDFSDPDSINTVFEYDINPFNTSTVDGDPTTTTGEPDRAIVYGTERPELLISEVSATHNRRNVDSSTDSGGSDTLPDDVDWDSGHLPVASTFIELYHPWTQSAISTTNPNGFQVLPAEFADPANLDGDNRASGVDLDKTGPDGTPVWRIGIKREKDPTAAFVRGLYFADPSGAPAAARTPGVNFYSTQNQADGSRAVLQTIQPGDYFVVGSAGNVTGSFTTTFGRPASGAADVINTRSITLDNGDVADQGVIINDWDGTAMASTTVNCGVMVIDAPHSFSLSGPDTDYEDTLTTIIAGSGGTITRIDEADGIRINPPLDTPLDTSADVRDRDAIWTNGVTEGFRFLYLQRLANPDIPFDIEANPYITIDIAEVDLLAFNGDNNDPGNTNTTERYDNLTDTDTRTAGPQNVVATASELRTIERGEQLSTDEGVAFARRAFFRTEQTNPPSAATPLLTDLHNLSFNFEQTLGLRNDSINGATPLGWLVFHNRPYANAMELVQVPYASNETLLDNFNFCREIEDVTGLTAASTAEEVFAYYLSDDKFGHLIGFGGMSPELGGGGAVATGTGNPGRREPTISNRFDVLLDYVDVPSRFLGSKTFLPANVSANASQGLLFNLNAPFNTIPNFREPGRVNLNTIFQQEVFNAVRGEHSTLSYDVFRNARNQEAGATNFAGLFTAASTGQYVAPGSEPRVSGAAGLLRRDTENHFFISNSPDADIYSWSDHDFQQRMDAMSTTRSSVFSIWITIGYFEVDEYGRVGAELGADEGELRRDRAFYMVDRSIPVACEPGKNHNVDNAVLVRTIIE